MYFILTSPGTSSPEQLETGVWVCVEWNICITLIGQDLSGLWFASLIELLSEGEASLSLSDTQLPAERTDFPAPGNVLLLRPFCQP